MTKLNFFRKLKTAQADAPDTGGSAAAAGPQPQREILGLRMRVVEGRYGVKDLIQAHIWTPTEEVRKSPAHFYCLDMDEATLGEAVNWIREARYLEPFDTRRVPVIILIGAARSLSPREWREVNEELKPAGGYFYKRPNYNANFEESMRSLRDELARQYGSPARRDEWRTQREPDLEHVSS